VTYVGDNTSSFANLARIDPILLYAKKPTPTYKNPYICFRGSSAPAKCLMVRFVSEDKTTEPFTIPKNGKIMKLFSLIPLSLKAEQNFATICILFGVETYTSDILGNVLTLTTRSEMPGKCLLSSIYPCTYYLF
jgi:hypothetical protein